MSYIHGISMSNIENIIEALNRGGILSCGDLMERIWNDATLEQVNRKIRAPRNPMLHNADYARKQLKQEMRRSLNAYFDEIGSCNHGIHRVNPVHDVEYFYVSSVHARVRPTSEGPRTPEYNRTIMERLRSDAVEADILTAAAADRLMASIDSVWIELGGPRD